MSFDRNKNYYNYSFMDNHGNITRETMTPLDAHKFVCKHGLKVLEGPGYIKGKKEKDWDGFGFHSGLRMSFKGPAHYRQYLKENNLVEAGLGDRPSEHEYKPPRWDENLIKEMVQNGIEIGSVLAEALLSGELDYPEDASSL